MELTDAWRCDGPCGQLMYDLKLVKGKLYPAETAPLGLLIEKENARVCRVCWEMYIVLTKSDYWKNLQEKNKDAKRKLGRGGDYLS